MYIRCTYKSIIMNLCIDWGNTLVKIALFNDDGSIAESHSVIESEVVSRINDLLAAHKPAKSILCSVVNNSGELESLLQSHLKAFVKLDSNTRLPVMNAYSSPGTLGADRLALAVGAYSAYPDKNTLVISIGTTITYNFIQKNKAFRGGAISPGMEMRFKALHQYTDRLPEVNADGELLLLGYDTETSIRSGVINGIVAEIEGILTAYTAQYPDFNAVLTGGGQAFFASKLKNKIFADPDLLLKGLNLILNYNVPFTR